MNIILLFVILLITINIAISQDSLYIWTTLSKFNHYTKRISLNINTGGRLQSREIGYLAAAGYKSILSIANFTTSDEIFNTMRGDWPSSEEEKKIANYYNLSYEFYTSSMTVESILVASEFISTLPKPIFIHCYVGYSATLFAQLHLIKLGEMDASDIYSNSLTLGYDYQSNPTVVDLISSFTNYMVQVTPPKIELTLTDGENSYKNYFWPHYINEIWYNQGQLLDSQVDNIVSQGYSTVISFRANGEPTTRLPNAPQEGPVDNHEFSDLEGNYDVKAEESAFTNKGVKFFNLPVSGNLSFTVEQYNQYSSTLLQVSNSNKPTLIHCTSGYRSSAYTIAFIAKSNNKCSDWALLQASKIGFSFDISPNDAKVVNFFQQVLLC